jgi:two-component system, OmpR family, copper resistance phosphate regulon response regulator CusR
MSILLADDDVQLATFLSRSLESEGYSVHTALDEPSVLSELKRQNYELIILDLNFGQTDGLRLLEKLRSAGVVTPILVLSARDHVSDRIQSLNLGADDYVTKPFSFRELAARANAILRRKADPSLSRLRVQDLELDPVVRKVRRGEREVKLSPKEFELLQFLMRRPGETADRRELLQECWGMQETDSNLVDVYVNYLRKKIDSSSSEKLIHTVRGTGYRLGNPAPALSSHHPPADRMPVRHTAATIAEPAATPDAMPSTTLRAMVHAVAHDLAQPLTSVRCFLEMMAMRQSPVAAPPTELELIEQQADRAVALAKAISALVREVPMPAGPWISLEALVQDLFTDFSVLLHSGLLTLERKWDPSIQVSSSPALRQLLVLFVSKLIGRNTLPFILTVAGAVENGRCRLDLRWRSADPSQKSLRDSRNMLVRELVSIQEIVASLGAELALPEGRSEIALKLPAASLASAAGSEPL